MKQIVLASGNAGKLREFAQMLNPLDFEVLPQSHFNVTDADEPHCTFVENALAKARHAAKFTGLPAMADDSGICVSALGGAPGVYSARYAGEPKSDERNNEKLIAALQGKTDRRAHYVAVLVFVRHAEDPQPIIVEGEWHGEIVQSLQDGQGTGGFGYDPYFWLPKESCTAAQLPPEAKNAVSHRGQALRQLIARLQQDLR